MKRDDRIFALQVSYFWKRYLARAKTEGKLAEALHQLKLERHRCLIQDPDLIVKFNPRAEDVG